MSSVRKSYQVVVMSRKRFLRRTFKDVFKLDNKNPFIKLDLIPKHSFKWKQKVIWVDDEIFKGFKRIKLHEMNDKLPIILESRRKS